MAEENQELKQNTLKVRLKHAYKTKEEWDTEQNKKLILLPGEIGIEANTNRFKIGDGNTIWVDLPYVTMDALSLEGGRMRGKVLFKEENYFIDTEGNVQFKTFRATAEGGYYGKWLGDAIPIEKGGTGMTNFPVNQILVGQGTKGMTSLPNGEEGGFLTSTGGNKLPEFRNYFEVPFYNGKESQYFVADGKGGGRYSYLAIGAEVDAKYKLRVSGLSLFDGNLQFTNTSNASVNGTTPKGIYGVVGGNDGWRIVGLGGANSSSLEIATCDDGSEPIYVRQYNSNNEGGLGYTTIARTLTLLDASGYTHIPGNLYLYDNVYFKDGQKYTASAIRFLKTESNEIGISINAGGSTLIGAGPLSSSLDKKYGGKTKNLYLSADGSIEFYSLKEIKNSKGEKENQQIGMILDASGNLYPISPSVSSIQNLGLDSNHWTNLYTDMARLGTPNPATNAAMSWRGEKGQRLVFNSFTVKGAAWLVSVAEDVTRKDTEKSDGTVETKFVVEDKDQWIRIGKQDQQTFAAQLSMAGHLKVKKLEVEHLTSTSVWDEGFQWPSATLIQGVSKGNNQAWTIKLGEKTAHTGTFFSLATATGEDFFLAYNDTKIVEVRKALIVGNYTDFPKSSSDSRLPAYALSVQSFISKDWVRTAGDNGWFNEKHGGGWYMRDTKWIRNWGNKQVLIGNGSASSLQLLSGQLVVTSLTGTAENGSILDSQGGNNVAIELWRGANASWQIANESGILYIRNNWYNGKTKTYSQTGLIMDYQSGAAALNYLAIGMVGLARNTEYRLYANGDALVNGTLTLTNAIYYKNTSGVTPSMIRFMNTTSIYNTGISIGGGGTTIIGAGEAASAMESIVGDTENLYMVADGSLYFYSNCDSIGNRIGMVFDTNRYLYPLVNKTGSLGTSSNLWASVYTNVLHIRGDASANMAYGTSNPRIVFSENGSQQVGIVYTDYDAYRASKGLKVMDVNNEDTDNVWLEVQGDVIANKSLYVKGTGFLNDKVLIQNTDYTHSSTGAIFKIINSHSKGGGVSGSAAVFSNIYGTHDYGVVQNLNIQQLTGDKASLRFSMGNYEGTQTEGTTSWSIGYVSGGGEKDYNFRIKKNHGWNGWGTEVLRLNTDGSSYWSGSATIKGQVYVNFEQDVGLNQNGSLIIGNKAGYNIGIDGNEIMARNNSATSVLYLNADGGSVAIGGYNNTSYALSAPSAIINSWIRTTGNTGWYNENYGGGIYMIDTTYVRVFNGKKFYSSGRYLSGAPAASSWLDGQRYERSAYDIESSTDTGSYWPWLRHTNTASKRWFSFGTLNNSFYFIGSTTSRTVNGYDNGMRFDVSNGMLDGLKYIGINGSSTSYRLYVNGNSYFTSTGYFGDTTNSYHSRTTVQVYTDYTHCSYINSSGTLYLSNGSASAGYINLYANSSNARGFFYGSSTSQYAFICGGTPHISLNYEGGTYLNLYSDSNSSRIEAKRKEGRESVMRASSTYSEVSAHYQGNIYAILQATSSYGLVKAQKGDKFIAMEVNEYPRIKGYWDNYASFYITAFGESTFQRKGWGGSVAMNHTDYQWGKVLAVETGTGTTWSDAVYFNSICPAIYYSNALSFGFASNNRLHYISWTGNQMRYRIDATDVYFNVDGWSDGRLKENIKDIKNIKNLYLELRPVSFTFKNFSQNLNFNNKVHQGLIAQEVEALLYKYGINADKYDLFKKRQLNEEDRTYYYSLEYENLHGFHIAFAQDFYKEFIEAKENHEERIKHLEEQIRVLQDKIKEIKGE